jgi:hypothetical protein
MHVPLLHVPEQHSFPAWQALPPSVQRQVPPALVPEQQPVESWLPGSAQQVPAPPQARSGSHCALTAHAMPSDGAQPKLPSGRPQQMGLPTPSWQSQASCRMHALTGSSQSVYAWRLPEQHISASVVTVPGPMHEQTPSQRPETHSLLPAQGEAFGSGAWHTPPRHAPDVQASSLAHGAPSPTLGAQVPPEQKLDWQPASPVHGSPFAFRPHVPSAQTADWQSPGPVQGDPSGFAPQVPSAHGPVMHCEARVHDCPAGRPQTSSKQMPDVQSVAREQGIPLPIGPQRPSVAPGAMAQSLDAHS